MLLARLQNIEKFYGDHAVLNGVNLELRSGARIALIGRNGAGKSTILNIFSGRSQADGGTVWLAADTVLGYLEQATEFPPNTTVEEATEAAFVDLDQMEERLEKLGSELSDSASYEAWETLHAQFERRGGYQRRARRDAVLAAFAFAGREQQLVSELSGGERTRLGLAVLLMQQPDVLLLDEPTNHLDIDMREWLEQYLARYQGALLIVSHDRTFLDAATNTTAEISRGELSVRPGNPTTYRVLTLGEKEIAERTRINQEREHARLVNAARQMKQWAGQNAKLHRRAKAMERRVERYGAEMIDAPLPDERTTRFTFPSSDSGSVVLQAGHLTKTYAGAPLFTIDSLELFAGDRVALVGPNGAGKSTLLRMLVGEIASDNPRAFIRTGARVQLGYYDQQLDHFDAERTLFEELLSRTNDQEAHDLLGRFMFPYDAQFKKIGMLSGGERARLALLELTMGEFNFLILDEPTNHLDVEMIEALENALHAYEGTLLMVSHDRQFMSSLVDYVWEVRDGVFEEYEGDWSFYTRRRAERIAAETAIQDAVSQVNDAPTTTRKRLSGGYTPWQARNRVEELETTIEHLEQQLEDVTAQLSNPASADEEALVKLSTEHGELEAQLSTAFGEWHTLTEELEGVD